VRHIAWLITLLFAGLAAGGYALATPQFDAAGGPRAFYYFIIGLTGLLSVFLFPRFKSQRGILAAIWIPALALRVLLLPTAVSDDVSRYLWEGRLVSEGLSPYAQTADAEALRAYRDAQWAQMNHKDQPTAYPPLAELLFAAVASVAYYPLAFKLFFLLADCATLAGLLRLLRLRGLALQYSGCYALSPVVLIAYAGEGHFDAVMVAALVWGLWAAAVGREKFAVVLVSLATGVKWIALPLLPLYLFASPSGRPAGAGPVAALWALVRQRSPYLLLAVLTLLLPALYFGESLPALFEGLFRFGGTRSFNGPVYDVLLLGLGWSRALCSTIVIAVFAGICFWRWCARESSSLDAQVRWVLGALIVLSPTVHFWYLAWILPFVCLRPSLPWVLLSLSSSVYFFVWSNDTWGLSALQRSVFWLPFGLALLYEFWSTRGRVMFPAKRPVNEAVTVSIVIPTLNVLTPLKQALHSVAAQSLPASEVICVDAGSQDGTLAYVAQHTLPVRVIESERGRGQQIAAGIAAASSSWVCVLHADAVLAPQALAQIRSAVAVDPTVCGGAFGQRFEQAQVELLPIEMLNDARAMFSRTAFGDQVQFFHRETAVRHQLMPAQPLMEDVESSWRLRETGGFLFLNQPCEVCHRSWEASQWLTRFCLVMRLVSRYRFARLSSRAAAEALSRSMYQEYYSTSLPASKAK